VERIARSLSGQAQPGDEDEYGDEPVTHEIVGGDESQPEDDETISENIVGLDESQPDDQMMPEYDGGDAGSPLT
jgi:hypothetical protein